MQEIGQGGWKAYQRQVEGSQPEDMQVLQKEVED
jgi:hypothetical protein